MESEIPANSAQQQLMSVRIPGQSTQKLKKFYDEWSEDYDKHLQSLEWNSPTFAVDALSKYLPDKHARILDCASGTGIVGVKLTELGYRDIEGVDLSEKCLNKAREKCVYKTLRCAKLDSEPLDGIEQDTYDAIVCSGGFLTNHLDDNCLKEWSRIVRSDGVICITVNADCLYLVEGPTLDNLVSDGRLQVVEKRKTTNHIGKEFGYVIVLKVL
ncbi:methyltransferase-like protein 27 [Saccoglossus kowalevskii]|uniref:Williams-Beuren syndrome chromosomal region 27 protein-like n=1 Tax=Saccoglossus kowalevskii TaxID=10224 RepID=A0ABM0M3L3_SACKO|nr:PREDICTED: Williams-Beuren syndrome chromosomal region 27 protein-like [Saccoglossus kowalevskii]